METIYHLSSCIGYREAGDFKLEDTLAFFMGQRQEGGFRNFK